MLHTRSSVKATRGREQADLDHFTARVGDQTAPGHRLRPDRALGRTDPAALSDLGPRGCCGRSGGRLASGAGYELDLVEAQMVSGLGDQGRDHRFLVALSAREQWGLFAAVRVAPLPEADKRDV